MKQYSNSFKKYVREIKEIPLISREEEVELANKIKAGDESAVEKLVESNLRLVVTIAHEYGSSGLTIGDLVSEGNSGLMRAAEKFDPEKGAKFSTYSAWWIKQSMRRAINDKKRTIRIPLGVENKARKIKSSREDLERRLGRAPTVGEIRSDLKERGLDYSERTIIGVSRRVENCSKIVSLDGSVFEGEDTSYGDVVEDVSAENPYNVLERKDFASNVLGRGLDVLNERERKIIVLRYGLDGEDPRTLQEVCELIDRTRERVRQLQNRALKKMREFYRENNSRRKKSMVAGSRTNNKRGLLNGEYEELKECDEPLETLRLNYRSYNLLHAEGVRTISDLAFISEDDALSMASFGEISLKNLKCCIREYYKNNLGNMGAD